MERINDSSSHLTAATFSRDTECHYDERDYNKSKTMGGGLFGWFLGFVFVSVLNGAIKCEAKSEKRINVSAWCNTTQSPVIMCPAPGLLTNTGCI